MPRRPCGDLVPEQGSGVAKGRSGGPLLTPGNDPAIPDYDSLAAFETEIAKNGAPKGVMKGTTAVAAGRFGAGRVFCFSPHPEKREPTRELLHKAVRWAVEK